MRSFLWREFGEHPRRRKQSKPGREAMDGLPRLCPRKRWTGHYLGFVGESLASESSGALFGVRPGRSSFGGERLSIA